MKKKTIIEVVATAVAITLLMVMTYHTEPSPPHNRPMSEVVEVAKAYTPPNKVNPLVSKEMPQTSTQSKEFIEPIPVEITPPQPTEKEESNNTPTPTTQTATKANVTSTTNPPTPKNRDIRIIDGQKQGYLLGFSWVDYMGENEVIFCEGMFENGNKVGTMGDINKIVGRMD